MFYSLHLKYFITLFAFLVIIPLGASAQVATEEASLSAPTEQGESAVLVANVNFMGVSTTSVNGLLHTKFSISSIFGSQDEVVFGILVRSQKTGMLLDSMTATDTMLQLREGVVVSKTVKYALPTFLPEAGDVYLSAYTKRGLSLATEKIATAPKGIPVTTCKKVDQTISCLSTEDGITRVELLGGGPFGNVVAEANNTLAKNVPSQTALGPLVEKLSPGSYTLLVRTTNKSGTLIGTFTADIEKYGDFAKLISIAPRSVSIDKQPSVEVVVFATVSDTSTPVSIIAELGDCGKSVSVPYSGKVETILIPSQCESGVVTVRLMRGAVMLDMMSGNFFSSQAVQSQTSGWGAFGSWVGLFLWLLIVTAIIVVFIVMFKKKPWSTVKIIAVFMIASSSYVGAQEVQAATYAIGGAPQYNTCVTGGSINCAEPNMSAGPSVTGTMTVPSSALAGSVYTVTYTLVTNNSVNTLCSGVPCTAGNWAMYVYNNLPPVGSGYVGMHLVTKYNTLPSPNFGSRPSGWIHYASNGGGGGTFSRTAPLSGTDVLSVLVQPAGTGVPIASCSPKWCLTYPYSHTNINVPIVAAATCDWVTEAYLGATGGIHNSVRCTTPLPSDGTPNPLYCNEVAEDGMLTVCCDSGADCFRYRCDYKAACAPPPPSPGSPPNPPTLTIFGGATGGYSNNPVSFVVTATDPDGDALRYEMDWNNDGSPEDCYPAGCVATVPSGTSQSPSRTWTTDGTFTVRARAVANGQFSGWTSLNVIITNQVSCGPAGSLYSWNGTGWDAIGGPSWIPGNFAPQYGPASQGPILSGPLLLVNYGVAGITALSSSGYAGGKSADVLQCLGAPLPYILTLTKAGSGGGTITSSPGGINCGADCSEPYAIMTDVTLTAIPDAFSTFSGWSGANCSGTGLCIATMHSPKNVIATFSTAGGPFMSGATVSAAQNTCGSIQIDVENMTAGPQWYVDIRDGATSVYFTSGTLASMSYEHFVPSGSAHSYTVRITDNWGASRDIGPIPQTGPSPCMLPLTVTPAGTGGGTITSSPAGINCGADCSEPYAFNTVVTLTATPNGASNFSGWSGGGCSGTGTCVVTMGAAQNVTATFTLSACTPPQVWNTSSLSCVNPLSVSVNPVPNNPQPTTAFTVSYTLTNGTAANTNCRLLDFLGVPVAGAAGTYAPCTGSISYTTGTSPGTYGFSIQATKAQTGETKQTPFTVTMDPAGPQTLTVTPAGSGAGTITSSPAGINCGADCIEPYAYGISVTLTATPSGLSSFSGWSGGGCSGTGTCVVAMNGAQNVTATFVVVNAAPTTPTIGGAVTGMINTSYTFTFTSTDPNGDAIRYEIDWDNNGSPDQTLPAAGTVASGVSQSQANNWAGSGVKTFQARAVDINGAASGWASHSITINTPPAILSVPASATMITDAGTSVNQTFTITNSGGSPLNITGSAVVGASFSCITNCGVLSIPPAGNQTITVRFSPPAVTNYIGTLNITSDSGGVPGTVTPIALNGIGTLPITPAGSLDYGKVKAKADGTSFKDLTFTIVNPTTVNIGAVTVQTSGAPYVCQANCSQNFGPNSSITFTMRFTPTALGDFTGTFWLNVDNTATWPITGTGVPSTIDVREQ